MAGAAVGLLLFIFIPFGFVTINTGEVAVAKVWGEAKEVKTAGLTFHNIVSTAYVKYDIRVQQIDVTVAVYTKDAQALDIELTVQYAIQADKVLDINKKYGTLEMLDAKIQNVAIEKAKVILSSETAMQLIETRATLSPKVLTAVKDMEEQYYINVTNVVIVDMAFSSVFEQAVEQKMIAEQEKLKAEYDKEKAIIKAEEELEVAKLKAAQALAKAEGDADAKIAVAKGEAESLRLQSIEVARMLGFVIDEIEIVDANAESGKRIEYFIHTDGEDPDKIALISSYIKFLNYLETWDGKLPTVISDGTGIYIPMP
ncbi:MAG: prohibitin family protein [Clostridiales bacterium]|nr:prohibitin family protein [Clostridiales bacterium]